MARQTPRQLPGSIELTVKYRPQKPSNSYSKLGDSKAYLLIIFGLILLLFAGWVTGINQWALKYYQCGGSPAVITPSGEDSESKRLLPGDKGYGPNFFYKYECMTRAEKTS